MHYKALVLFKMTPEIFEEIELEMNNRNFKYGMINQFAKKLEKPFLRLSMDAAEKEEDVKFADWTAEDVITIKDLLNNLDKLEEIYPEAIFTTELKWLEITSCSRKAVAHWEREVIRILEKYKNNGIALVIDYNI